MVRHSALLQSRHLRPDAARVAGISVALLVNLTLFGMLMRPMSFTAPSDAPDPHVPVPIIRPPLPITPPVVPVNHERKPQPTAHARTPIKAPPVTPQAPTNNATNPVAVPIQPVPMASVGTDTIPQPPAAPTALTVLVSPAPTYPRDALREGVEGTVVLELRISAEGRVLDAHVVRGSGDRRLDAAAREQVLRAWRFQPATRNGVPIEALGQVSVVFRLDAQ